MFNQQVNFKPKQIHFLPDSCSFAEKEEILQKNKFANENSKKMSINLLNFQDRKTNY